MGTPHSDEWVILHQNYLWRQSCHLPKTCCQPEETAMQVTACSSSVLVISWQFSQMRNKGSRFTLGDCVFARRCVYVRNPSQPSATVCNRPQPSARGRYGRAYGKFCKKGHFWRFTCGVASFRVAGVALRDIQTCFVTCRKSLCVAGTILLRRFQKMRRSFRGRRSTLDVSSFFVARAAL